MNYLNTADRHLSDAQPQHQRTVTSIVVLGALATAALTVVLVALLLGLGVATAAAQEIDPPVPNPTVSASDGAALAQMVNEYRVANGLNPLVIDPAFAARTEPHAQRLTALNPTPPTPAGYSFWCPDTTGATFFHDSPDAQWASAPNGAVGYGENIAFRCSQNFATHPSDIMTSWRNSPGHNTNMLNPDWTHIASVSVRWNNVSIAVHRFATVPGTAAPAVNQPAPTPTATPIPAPTATPIPEQAAAPEATAIPTEEPTTEPTATPQADATDDQVAVASSSAATASAGTAAAAGPQQLAFTGTNLNLALLGLALIVGGAGLLLLPSVRGISKDD